MKVGFIVLGQIEHGMASNLLQARHDITVYKRSPRKADDLIARGARNAVSIAEVCGSDAVMTMLSYDKAVEHLELGQEGIVASLAKSAIHISSNTISVGLAEQLTAAHVKAGQHFVSTPVFGRPDAAAAGNYLFFQPAPKHREAHLPTGRRRQRTNDEIAECGSRRFRVA
jgi:3-hydroxyisobutyrate dehydrogenase-like beta-hydroxyacid dehydrogenase